jgi:putative acetyltransferase
MYSPKQADTIIRYAHIEDADTIAQLLYHAFAEYEHLYTPGGFSLTTPSATQIRARWHEGPVWIAFCDGQPAGTVAAVPRTASLYMRSMAVARVYRGIGLGKSLLQEIDNYARSTGFGMITLSTTPFLHDAIRLYEHWGFQFIEGGASDLDGTPLLSMEKIVR